ncbi:glycosyltransferase [Flavobacterium sp. 83]|uniref:glycosyltransferase n=1 Tax=Flavobacterium sp. 83 TaxID=1131812 RepID=UPI000AF4B4A5|nr:glycosyltransferase [Flavobacterium sp. 83]
MKAKEDFIFSFIIPVYNAECFISQCVDSIIDSNTVGVTIEIILVNDGSTDGSNDILMKYFKKFSFVKVFTKENGGVSSARNRGLEEASGEYICFVDCDDMVSSNYISNLIMYGIVSKPDVIQIGFTRESNTRSYNVSPKRNRRYENLNDFFRKESYTHAVWSYVFKRSLIVDNNIVFDNKLHYSEDQDFIIKVFANSKNVFTNKGVLYFYKDIASSAVNKSVTRERALAQLKVILNLVSTVPILYKYHRQVVSDLLDDYFIYSGKVQGFPYQDVLKEYKLFAGFVEKKNFVNFPYFKMYMPLYFGRLYFISVSPCIRIKKSFLRLYKKCLY